MRAGDKIERQSGAKCRLCSQKWTKTKVCHTENSSKMYAKWLLILLEWDEFFSALVKNVYWF